MFFVQGRFSISIFRMRKIHVRFSIILFHHYLQLVGVRFNLTHMVPFQCVYCKVSKALVSPIKTSINTSLAGWLRIEIVVVHVLCSYFLPVSSLVTASITTLTTIRTYNIPAGCCSLSCRQNISRKLIIILNHQCRYVRFTLSMGSFFNIILST